MKKLRYFKCASTRKSFDRWVEDKIKIVECDCGELASRELASPKYWRNTTGKAPA